jgi:hypothetical protein
MNIIKLGGLQINKVMAANDQEYSAAPISNKERLQMRCVPMFPLNNSGRPKSAGPHYRHVRAKISTKYHHVPGGGNKQIVNHGMPNYDKIESKTDSSRPFSFQKIHHHQQQKKPIELNDTKKFYCIQSKVDQRDPAPWMHRCRHGVEELVEVDGFKANPRFDYIVKSQSFDSIGDLLHCFTNDTNTVRVT